MKDEKARVVKDNSNAVLVDRLAAKGITNKLSFSDALATVE